MTIATIAINHALWLWIWRLWGVVVVETPTWKLIVIVPIWFAFTRSCSCGVGNIRVHGKTLLEHLLRGFLTILFVCEKKVSMPNERVSEQFYWRSNAAAFLELRHSHTHTLHTSAEKPTSRVNQWLHADIQSLRIFWNHTWVMTKFTHFIRSLNFDLNNYSPSRWLFLLISVVWMFSRVRISF